MQQTFKTDTMLFMKRILVLCRVVDNYGDIGFVYRLLRALTEISFEYEVTLSVSDMASFSRMCPEIDSEKKLQQLNGWNVIPWDGDFSADFVKQNVPDIVFECFQCGRPSWLEDILFDESFNNDVYIINIEYLTAENWADDFHLLKSGTRRKNVKKINFMPGFTKKTAGLVLFSAFVKNLSDRSFALKKLTSVSFEKKEFLCNENFFPVSFFSYEKNCDALVSALEKFVFLRRKENPLFS